MKAGRKVKLPSGLVVEWPKGAVWLYEACPERAQHSPFPADFNPGNGLSKTHLQAIHPVCGLWALWVKRVERAELDVPEPGPGL